MTKFYILFLSLILFPSLLWAESSPPLRVAVATNFITALELLIPPFTAKYDIKPQPAFGSSGKLYAQIKNGAPYDLFLSADHERPRLLYEAGICEAPFVYAFGSVVLWTWDTTLMADTWQESLESTDGRISIANPETAPYGTRGLEAIQKTGLTDTVVPRLVYGQSAGQAFVFVQTGNTHFGFIAHSLALSEHGQKGKYWSINEAKRVDQWGCVIKKSKNREAAQALISFFATDTAREIFHKLGYDQ